GIRLSYGGHEWDIAADYGGERLHIIRDQNSTEGLVIRNGKVGIGTTDPAGQVGLDAYQGGTVGSAVAGHNKQLVLGGEYNTGFNTGSSVKLLISDYDNNTDANIYPIYCEDEQNRVDFYVRKQEGSVSTEYFGGNVGIGTKNPRSKLSVGGDGDQYVSIYSF
ncbi:MAG: hypothetical protein OEW48_14870, partial [Phycisphaerae bacterium]|nr:hypothetical protein [Phycisphaerae bacterium]